ncbi:hypothetical protein T492DRAFT_835775 [Pavlovales sp. CCMP2436]|nr:hypothetical protein T492DRAFT_835775 [Pavlovales sp. CCMP2436]
MALALMLAVAVAVAVAGEPAGVGLSHAERIGILLDHIEPAYKETCAANTYYDRLTWGDGTYIDIGANNATWISNTLFFDKCLGWRGVCFEPQSKYHAAIRAQRGCKLVPSCVLGHAATGRIVGKGRHAHFVEAKASKVGGSSLACAVASEALEEQGFKGTTVDLVSIDIEGAEADVLRCFPFDAFNMRAVLIEVDKHNKDALALWFLRRGYTLEQTFLLNRPAVYPPGGYGHLALDFGAADAQPPTVDIKKTCEKFARHSGWYCSRWMHWLSPAINQGARIWRACAAPIAKHK